MSDGDTEEREVDFGPGAGPSELIEAGKPMVGAIKDVLSDAVEIIVVSGYVTTQGFGHIAPEIKACLGRGGTAHLLFGIDQSRVAGPELVGTLGRMLTKYSPRLQVGFIVERPGLTFLHAKVYFARRRDGNDRLLIGSANLTRAGLQSNHELALREAGALGRHRERLVSFIEGLKSRQALTVDNYRELVHKMEPVDTEAHVDRLTRRQTEERTQELLKALAGAVPTIVESPVSVSDWVASFLGDGDFFNYDFDLEKLTVSSGLQYFQDLNVLAKVEQKTAGTARVRRAAISAAFPMLPNAMQRTYRRIAARLGKSMSRFGFDTPFGFWVPTPYQLLLKTSFSKTTSDLLPDPNKMAIDIKRHVEEHKRDLSATIGKILRQASGREGIHHPSKWSRKPRGRLAEIYDACHRPRSPWNATVSEYNETKKILREEMKRRLDEQLNPELAIAKVRCVRPSLLPLNVNLADYPESAAHFLGNLAWDVAELHLRPHKRKTRHAVLDLAGCVRPGVGSKVLVQLSEILTSGGGEPLEGAERFFRIFGLPPIRWTSGFNDDQRSGSDQDIEDEI